VVVLVCLETLDVKTVGFEAPDWKGDVKPDKEEE
jgi:hypothetical protein